MHGLGLPQVMSRPCLVLLLPLNCCLDRRWSCGKLFYFDPRECKYSAFLQDVQSLCSLRARSRGSRIPVVYSLGTEPRSYMHRGLPGSTVFGVSLLAQVR